jgi:signal transduction histidine kinase
MKISTRIYLGFSIILILFLLVTLINMKLSRELNANADFLRKSTDVIRTSNALQRNIVDMENGLSSFLLIGEESFLEPYQSGQQQADELFTELGALIAEENFQKQKLTDIKKSIEQWQITFADPFIKYKRNALKSEKGVREFNEKLKEEIKSDYGKNISGKIRQDFKEINTYEYKLRRERELVLNKAIEKTSLISNISIFLAIVFGLVATIIITRIISLRINKMVSAAEQISKGDFKIYIEDSSKDELKKLSDSLNIMAVKLDQSFSELNQFAYIVSHDLKAPLRGIENVIRWIEEDEYELNNNIKNYMFMIKNRAKRMENFIEGILELSRIDRLNSEISSVNVDQLLDDVIDLLTPPASMQIHIRKMPVIKTERIYLHQVFQNLIGNAIKYHNKPNGNIWINFSESEDFYRFSVKDDGPGIDSEYHDKIFLLFQTLQERDAFESTGVGLSIVKKIIEKKHGTIEVHSELDHGAEFNFTWPKKTKGLN